MKTITLIGILLLTSCAAQPQRAQVEIIGTQYCERQIVTINPFYQHRSYFWIENADGSVDITNTD